MDHLDSYKSLMSLQGCSDEIMCKTFSATLKGPARSWFRKLSPGTIDSFGELSRLFVANFISCRNRQKNASHLFTVHQKETESLKDFVKRIQPSYTGSRGSQRQTKPTSISPQRSYPTAKRRRRGKDDHKRKEPDTRQNDYREETRYKRPDRDPKRSNNRRPRTPPRRLEFILPPLNAPVAQVLSKIKHEEFVKWPEKIKTDPRKRNRSKYCEFHWDHGHNTEDCFQLKEQIADLIKRGYLRKYVADHPPSNSPERRYGDNRPTTGNIQTIHGGFRSGGCSTSSRKRHARSAFRLAEEEIYNLFSPCVGGQPPITFSNDDLKGLHLPHDDALVTTVWQDFIVVDCPSPYNAILGRPMLGRIKAITSTYHLKMKFPTLTGIGEVKGDQKVARQCFISAMKVGTSVQARHTSSIGRTDEKGILPKDKLQARRLQYRSTRFCIFKGRLYKRSFSGPLLRCLRPKEAEYVLREIHEGICRNHFEARSLAKKTIRQGHFWPTIERDAVAYIKRCDKCQRFAPVSRLPHTEMVTMSSPWPFAQWGIDILGPLPQAPLQRKFLIVAIDYFTKWIAQPLAKITEKNTRDFVWKHLVCRFGVPKVIISDNAKQFDNDSRIPTSETPYSMVFGTESVIPVEIGMPSFRISNFDKESNEAELRLNLDLLEEKRENAELRQMAYKCQVSKYYNQRVRHRSFLPGDLILRKVTLPTKEPNAGKLGPT
ncbi:hypothetical protein Acr_07g0010730 [Actinidia rufa]|uniref:Integrase catalytic domain-containing protein n=1 Tax=Actinidia rufa TaxID=165716 RepID=A0A7J0EZ17_9ERIC|nr:hypothetical protein Acr_07g0010730 [Actinidia rufa]